MPGSSSEFWWPFLIGSFGLMSLSVALLAAVISAQRRKQALEREQFREIGRREQRYRSLFANSIAGFVRLDLAAGTVIEANIAAHTMFRCAESDGLNTLFSGPFASVIGLLRAGKTLEQSENEYRFPDGTAGWFLLSGRVNEQEATGELVVVDITHEKQFHTDLLRSQRLDSIGTLSSGIAHDLNGFLTPIVMYAEYIEQATKSAAVRRSAVSIQRNADHAAHLIQRLLTFARGTEFQRVPLRPGDLAVEFKELIGHRLSPHILLEIDVPERTWCISGDSNHLLQVFTNLCINARDAMPSGGTLTVRSRNVARNSPLIPASLERDCPYVAFDIRDTGTGIAAEQLPHIFDPFFTTKEPGRGTGLGLSLSHSIIRGHGGIITVESTVGKGSTFSVWLPAGETQLQMPAKRPARRLAAAEGPAILIVDDDTEILDAMEKGLRRNRFRVLRASDGKEGLQEYLTHQRDIGVAVIDVMMPAVSGLTMIRAIRAIDQHLPVVAISGLEFPAELAGESLVQATLRKPFRIIDLVRLLGTLLQRRTKAARRIQPS